MHFLYNFGVQGNSLCFESDSSVLPSFRDLYVAYFLFNSLNSNAPPITSPATPKDDKAILNAAFSTKKLAAVTTAPPNVTPP